jgi:hypothetical protein
VGRILDGVTGAPLDRGFVLAYSGTCEDQLSQLTPADWDLIDRFDLHADDYRSASKLMQKIYTFQQWVRVDLAGHYRLELKPGQETHSLCFFSRDVVPFTIPVHQKIKQGQRVISIPDVRLYPAAYVTVKPIPPANEPEKRFSALPRWDLDEGLNPSWALEMIPWVNWKRQNEGQFEYDTFIRAGNTGRVYVPANVYLKLKLETPYGQDLCDLTIPVDIHLPPGAHLDLGDWEIPKAQSFWVRVTDPDGQPVEGLPLRCALRKGHWGIAHNTDASGLVRFYAPPGSTVSIGVSAHDLGATSLGYEPRRTWPVVLESDAQEAPLFEVTVSREMLDIFHGRAR